MADPTTWVSTWMPLWYWPRGATYYWPAVGVTVLGLIATSDTLAYNLAASNAGVYNLAAANALASSLALTEQGDTK